MTANNLNKVTEIGWKKLASVRRNAYFHIDIIYDANWTSYNPNP